MNPVTDEQLDAVLERVLAFVRDGRADWCGDVRSLCAAVGRLRDRAAEAERIMGNAIHEARMMSMRAAEAERRLAEAEASIERIRGWATPDPTDAPAPAPASHPHPDTRSER